MNGAALVYGWITATIRSSSSELQKMAKAK